jgi:NAD-dependent DNA ligase
VGAESAKLLARSFGTLDALEAAPVEQLEALHGVGAPWPRRCTTFLP